MKTETPPTSMDLKAQQDLATRLRPHISGEGMLRRVRAHDHQAGQPFIRRGTVSWPVQVSTGYPPLEEGWSRH